MSGFWPRIVCNEYEYGRGFLRAEVASGYRAQLDAVNNQRNKVTPLVVLAHLIIGNGVGAGRLV